MALESVAFASNNFFNAFLIRALVVWTFSLRIFLYSIRANVPGAGSKVPSSTSGAKSSKDCSNFCNFSLAAITASALISNSSFWIASLIPFNLFLASSSFDWSTSPSSGSCNSSISFSSSVRWVFLLLSLLFSSLFLAVSS